MRGDNNEPKGGSTADDKADTKNARDIEEPSPTPESPLLEYLRSDNGHEIALKIVGIVDDIKKASLEKNHSYARYGIAASASIVIAVVLAAGFLAYFDKFDSPIAILFGTVVGYFFGKRRE